MDNIQRTLKKSEIGALWNKHCSKFISTESESAQRLAFVLAHYQLWIERAAEKTLNAETEITSIQELMDLLRNYSRPSMMDDYYAIKALIEMENDDNYNEENDDQKTDESNSNNIGNNINQKPSVIREYFLLTLGQCKNFSNCRSFVRNRRPRSLDSVKKERREAFYIRSEDVQKYGNAGFSRFEVKEVILQSSLDVIHNYIFHAMDEEMNVNKSHQSKFVTDVGEQENDSKSNNDNNEQKVKKMGQYSFGYFMDYWIKSDPFFVSAKYPDLKTELTSNSLHPITMLAYEALEEQARDILKTKYGKNLKSKRVVEWMQINGKKLIPMGSLITEMHLISVLAYTNHGEMQYKFKKHGFRKLDENEVQEDVRKRNSEIAHWSRALFEVIHCWGSVMSKKKPLFHGISCKLLFEEFSQLFFMPTSLTTNQTIAQNFAKENGIILVLRHARENDFHSLMFDVSSMSDFPNEEERLIFRSKVQFYDILLDGQSLKQWMKILRIYERIRFGEFLSHVDFSEAEQEMIVCMMDNYLEDKKSKNKKNAEFYENGNIPNYIQLCFNECTNVGDIYFINSFEIKHSVSNEQLLQYLDGSQKGKNSKFLTAFGAVRETHVYEWLVTGDEYVSYFSDAQPYVIDHRRNRIIIGDEMNDDPLYFEFHWELMNSKSNGLLRCDLVCDHLPAEVSELNFNLGLYIKETNSEISGGEYVSHQRMYAGGLHNIVDSKKLMMENNSEMKQNEFHVKIRVGISVIKY